MFYFIIYDKSKLVQETLSSSTFQKLIIKVYFTHSHCSSDKLKIRKKIAFTGRTIS